MNCCSSVDEQIGACLATAAEIRMPAGVRRDQRGRLLRGYLHKSSNSLCGIKGYASLIAGGPGATSRATAWARKIVAEVEQLEDMYRSVRDMAFPVPAPNLGAHDLATVVADAVDSAAARHANLRAGPFPLVAGDLLLPAGDLHQILAEILDNSAESRQALVEVTLTVCAGDAGRLALAIADDGPGMPRELLAQAIDPFVTTRPGHLGIGLARVDTIMDMHGLGWGLRSVPDHGTTVTVEVARPRTGGRRP
ncbi:MAG TPA: sensor histidine kinase [Candidatus Krumholzibacteria bacterium]|nr:sensor histidine kinase [Candidatus Krumholzibacteria bacterium]HPD71635.1 sensor histidine kinase [Candidatus Krumholzibacteria bacterium]HRY41432.1 sensor histidine kinase [Candidatus Krumholzibacteria bacterium]